MLRYLTQNLFSNLKLLLDGTRRKISNDFPEEELAVFYTRGRIIRLDEFGQTFVVRRVMRP